MSELPSTWCWASIGELSKAAQYGTSAKTSDQGAVPVLRMGNIVGGRLELKSLKFLPTDHPEFPDLLLDDGDVLFNRTNSAELVGKTAVYRGRPGTTSFASYLIRIKLTGYIPELLSAYINSPMGREWIAGSISQQVGQANVNGSKLRALRVPLMPEAEQRRIVAKLDALTARTARARADLDRVPVLARHYRLALLRAALTGQLTEGWRAANPDGESADELVARTPQPSQGRGGREATTSVVEGRAALSVNRPARELPAMWRWTPLLRLARQETGHTPSRNVASYWNGGVPWIGIRDAGAHHGGTISETFQTISHEGLANSSARLLPAGTVCLSRTASVGYVTIMGREMATSQDFATWTCTPALQPKYLMYALMAEGDDIREFGEGSTHTTIYFPEIRALNIALAPLPEQLEIIRIVEAGLAEIDRLVAEAAAARRLLDRLDQAILAKAFRGELVPQDPADEPASVLLERIRAERAAAPAKPGRGRRAKAA